MSHTVSAPPVTVARGAPRSAALRMSSGSGPTARSHVRVAASTTNASSCFLKSGAAVTVELRITQSLHSCSSRRMLANASRLLSATMRWA